MCACTITYAYTTANSITVKKKLHITCMCICICMCIFMCFFMFKFALYVHLCVLEIVCACVRALRFTRLVVFFSLLFGRSSRRVIILINLPYKKKTCTKMIIFFFSLVCHFRSKKICKIGFHHYQKYHYLYSVIPYWLYVHISVWFISVPIQQLLQILQLCISA